MSEEGIVWNIAITLGVSPDAFRLLLSLILAYPPCILHRNFLLNKPVLLQHLFFIITGTWLGYFAYGPSIFHSHLCILIQYLMSLILGRSKNFVIASFIFQMGYLLIAYFVTETEKYDIKWTIPHCVLTLRLIGQACDVYDGTLNEKDLSSEQKQTAIYKQLSIIESSAHCLYPGSFMIGPQYPVKRYFNFVEDSYKLNQLPSSLIPGLKRLLLGLFYVGMYQLGAGFIPDEQLTSPDFLNKPLFTKLLLIGIYGKFVLYKYVSCWIVIEGACIAGGVSYNGKDKDGEVLWNGCENIDILVFEKSHKFGHLISSFNKCTNKWVARNVYKRLKFLGNRHVSQAAALLFLAVWHGLHTGYYICFFMEFIVMNAEKQFLSILSKSVWFVKWHSSSTGVWVDYLVAKFFLFCLFGYCLVPFTLLKFHKWWKLYKSLYFCGTLLFGLFPVYAPLIKAVFFIGGTIKSEKVEPDHSSTKHEPVVDDNSKKHQ